MKRWIRCLMGLTATAALASLAAAQGPPSDYAIGAKDLLEIRVLELPELNVERRVTDAGRIDLPLLGELVVSGMTPSELRGQIQGMLTAKYVNRANVSIVIKDFASKPVSVVGAVQKPGSLSISGRYSLLQAISAAGGLTEQAGKRIYVLRRADNGLSDMLEVHTDDLFRGSSVQWDIPLVPGDTVNIPSKRLVTVFCLGEVKQSGALDFDSEDRISVLTVIAKAGGLTDRASRKIRIKRRGPEGKETELVYDYKRILAGKDPDALLQPGDVLVVKESFL
jgi:polysaccharide export outer membrane protein